MLDAVGRLVGEQPEQFDVFQAVFLLREFRTEEEVACDPLFGYQWQADVSAQPNEGFTRRAVVLRLLLAHLSHADEFAAAVTAESAVQVVDDSRFDSCRLQRFGGRSRNAGGAVGLRQGDRYAARMNHPLGILDYDLEHAAGVAGAVQHLGELA